MSYRILCVDDEEYSLNSIQKLCLSQNPDNTVYAFSDSSAALAFAENNPIDIALLDVDMPNLNGIFLTRELMKQYPHLNVIMTTAYEEYALPAFSNNCSGYLLKPITLDSLNKQFGVLRFPLDIKPKSTDITVTCFGDFAVFFRGEPVSFYYSMTKELLAYLIDRKGALCSNRQIMATLWQDDDDHTPYLKLLKKDLQDTFAKLTDVPVFSVSRGFIAVKKENIDCDYFRFGNGERDLFMGEYMEQYSWAENTKANLLFRMENNHG